MKPKLLFYIFLAATVLQGQVSVDRILRADEEPHNWLTYSRTYNGQRFSPLDQINVENAGQLRPAWIYQSWSAESRPRFETSPLAVDDVLYITEQPSNATALDARTGRPLWKYERDIPADAVTCCGRVNRGMAILGDLLYLGTIDAHLVALDRVTGKVKWDVEVVDYQDGYSLTAAPLIVGNKVIVGVAGGEFGVRGFIEARDAETGEQAWRFWTIPGPGEPGNETWGGESWKTGSATSWATGAYDPDLNLIYWGTGNPGPDYDGGPRPGDNLYSCSLVAIDADTGKLRWHFQFTPHDTHDWDSNHVPVLVDRTENGQQQKLIMVANRNGFFYVLDRATGKFLLGKPYARQNWAKGLDENGRPIVIPNMDPSPEGPAVYPGLHGGTNWFSPTYSPETGLFYISMREEGTRFFVQPVPYKRGALYVAGGPAGIPSVEPGGAVIALDPRTGDRQWEFPLASPPWAGLLSTAGGLVFGGSNEGTFFALDAKDGRPLWHFQTGGWINANPMTWMTQGKQYVAVPSGRSIVAFSLP